MNAVSGDQPDQPYYDVLIVGGGPAGSALAWSLKEMGDFLPVWFKQSLAGMLLYPPSGL